MDMKILAIGNSFSEDATALLQLLAPELFVRNMYIGGCSLQRHCSEAQNNAASYIYEENGADSVGHLITLQDALTREKWDVITVQQVSGQSGRLESYYPYLPELISYVRKYSAAEIVFHQTWAYDHDTDHPDFALYGKNQQTMRSAIKEASETASQREGLRVIPVGEMIALLRRTPVFDKQNGGLSLTRDGYHLSLNYGRYAAALVWCYFFTGKWPEALKEYDSKPFRTIYKTLYKGLEG